MDESLQAAVEPLELVRSDQDAEDIATAVRHYAKHLENLAGAALKEGKAEEARLWKAEAEGLIAEVVVPWEEEHRRPTIYEHHVPAIRIGLDYLVKRLRAARGTVKGLGLYRYRGTVDGFENHAQHVEQGLLAQVREQPELPLEGDQNDDENLD